MTIRATMTVGLAALVAALGVVACGGSDSSDDDNGTGGSSAAGDDDSEAAAGTTSQGDDDTTAPIGYPCSDNAQDAFSDLITDFSVTEASGSNFNWGASEALTGGTFVYDNVPDDGTDALTLSIESEALHVAGSYQEYAGFGLWFGPCVNGAAYGGISFTISGDLGNSQLVLQVQTSKNYPFDDNAQKGECEGDWNTCISNSFTVEVAATTDAPAQGVVVTVPWASLTGGLPNDGTDGSELLGVQWQFNCESGADCAPDITIDDVKFSAAG